MTAIATRTDLDHAKRVFDNLDNITGALAVLNGKTGAYSVTVAPGVSIMFDIADLATFLTSIQAKHVAFLSTTYGIAAP